MSLRPRLSHPPDSSTPATLCDVAAMRRALEVAATEARAWSAKADATPSIGVASNDVVGLLISDPATLLTFRNLYRHLKLCRVNQERNKQLSCTNKDVWRGLLRYAESRTNVDQYNGILDKWSEVDARVVTMDNPSEKQAALEYKRAFIEYVVFRAIVGFSAYGGPTSGDDFRRDHPPGPTYNFDLIPFRAQVMTFLGRSNGSITRIVDLIKQATKGVRTPPYGAGDPDFPEEIPAEFFVSAIQLIQKMHAVDHGGSNAGYANVPKLIEEIKKQDFY